KAVVLSGVNATSSPGIPMSVGFLILDFTLIIATGSPVTKAVLPSGVTRTLIGVPPTGISVGFLVPVFTSIVATELAPGSDPAARLARVTKAVLPSGVIATPLGKFPTGMSAGFLVLVLTSMVDTLPLALLVTTAVLPSCVIASPNGPVPAGMSAGLLVLVFTSMVDTVPLP